MGSTPILEIEDVGKAYSRPDGGELLVLDGIDLALREGEIVGLLGRSGSGKSTLLRLIAGLVQPTRGEIRFMGAPVRGPSRGIAMMFQTFALFPWLTVFENVAIGLEALALRRDEIRQRCLDAIDLIGLDGFESAYPRELSGGMRQRVGFARALVVHPDILLMDEPFSALDVLTAETLRADFLDLWSEGQLPTKAVVLVTHNIEEAVLMCNRIVVFTSHPGRIFTEIKVALDHPRDRHDPAFHALVESIYVEMTGKPATEHVGSRAERFPGTGIATILPTVSTNLMAGLIEAIAAPPHNGMADLPVIAASLRMNIDKLFPVADTLQLFRFAELAGGDIKLLPEGQKYAAADPDGRKGIFADHLLMYSALAAHIRRVLDERPSHRAPWHRFSDELEDHMSPEAAEKTLRTVISWARYAEVFAYDDHAQIFSLAHP